MVRYYFGRLNVIAPRTDKSRLLVDALQQGGTLTKRGVNWGFFNVSIVETSSGPFIQGFLVKYKPRTEEEVAVPETHDLNDQTIQNRVRAKARFFIHLPSQIVAYHPVGLEISRWAFVRRFVELFKESLGQFFVEAEILSIDEEHRFRDVLQRLERISRIQIYLHPSNPSNRDVWRRTDERLRSLGASSYREEYDSESDSGLNVRGDEDIDRKVAMAEDGYGHVELTGQSGGRRVKVSTRDNPITAQAPTDEAPPELVLEDLAATLARILSRFGQ